MNNKIIADGNNTRISKMVAALDLFLVLQQPVLRMFEALGPEHNRAEVIKAMECFHQEKRSQIVDDSLKDRESLKKFIQLSSIIGIKEDDFVTFRSEVLMALQGKDWESNLQKISSVGINPNNFWKVTAIEKLIFELNKPSIRLVDEYSMRQFKEEVNFSSSKDAPMSIQTAIGILKNTLCTKDNTYKLLHIIEKEGYVLAAANSAIDQIKAGWLTLDELKKEFPPKAGKDSNLILSAYYLEFMNTDVALFPKGYVTLFPKEYGTFTMPIEFFPRSDADFDALKSKLAEWAQMNKNSYVIRTSSEAIVFTADGKEEKYSLRTDKGEFVTARINAILNSLILNWTHGATYGGIKPGNFTFEVDKQGRVIVDAKLNGKEIKFSMSEDDMVKLIIKAGHRELSKDKGHEIYLNLLSALVNKGYDKDYPSIESVSGYEQVNPRSESIKAKLDALLKSDIPNWGIKLAYNVLMPKGFSFEVDKQGRVVVDAEIDGNKIKFSMSEDDMLRLITKSGNWEISREKGSEVYQNLLRDLVKSGFANDYLSIESLSGYEQGNPSSEAVETIIPKPEGIEVEGITGEEIRVRDPYRPFDTVHDGP